MKFATFEFQGRESFGVVTHQGIAEIPSLWAGGPRSLLEALAMGKAALDKMAVLAAGCKTFLHVSAVRLKAPIPAPPKVIGLAVNYVEHHREFHSGADLPDDPARHTTPRPFLMPATAVIGPGDEIVWPSFSQQIDHEIELAVVIGSTCRRVSVERALEHVAGYTIANDMSARSCTHAQGRTARPKDDFFDWLHGKWADGFCPMGPYLVTADEVGDPQKLELCLTVNGEVRQKSNTSLMIFDVAKTVSFISHLMTLVPGDVIASGTPSGVAAATGKWLKGGDVITCRIDKLGELTNTLGPAPEKFYTPCAR